MEDVAKSILDLAGDKPALGVSKPISPMPVAPLRSSTARERIGNAVTELEALVNDLQTLIKTLHTIRERL